LLVVRELANPQAQIAANEKHDSLHRHAGQPLKGPQGCCMADSAGG